MILYVILYDMIYLLTANVLPPGGSSTVHIYTQTIQYSTVHIYTQTVQYSTHLHTNNTVQYSTHLHTNSTVQYTFTHKQYSTVQYSTHLHTNNTVQYSTHLHTNNTVQYSTHLHTNSTQNDTINFGRVWAVHRLCEVYPGICLTTEGKARKNLSQGSEFTYTEQLASSDSKTK